MADHPFTAENLILSHQDVQRKIQRIAYEIYEQNLHEAHLLIAGVKGGGFHFAAKLQAALSEVSPIGAQLCQIYINKKDVLSTKAYFEVDGQQLAESVIIVADDVLNTGKTLAYSLVPFLQFPVRKLQVAVLVDREHRSFPVAADYVGYSLSTTVNQHIEARLADAEMGVYLY